MLSCGMVIPGQDNPVPRSLFVRASQVRSINRIPHSLQTVRNICTIPLFVFSKKEESCWRKVLTNSQESGVANWFVQLERFSVTALPRHNKRHILTFQMIKPSWYIPFSVLTTSIKCNESTKILFTQISLVWNVSHLLPLTHRGMGEERNDILD